MEITESMVYWVTRLDDIKYALLIPVFLAPICIFITIGIALSGWEFLEKKCWLKWLKTFILLDVLLCVLSSVWVFVPTTKQMCAIMVLPILKNDEAARKLPKEIVDTAREWVEELKPNKNLDLEK